MIQNAFGRFICEVTPTKAHYEDAVTKSDGVAKTLHSHYYDDPYSGTTKRLIGSYGKGTALRPPRDVDILFLLPNEEYQRYKSYESNGPSQLLQDVKSILQDHYTTTDKMRGDGHVVVIPFEGYHTVELLPAWKTMSGKYIVPDTHDGGSWTLVDQTAEMVNVDGSNILTNGITRSLIRLLKAWQVECSVPIKSLVLELHAVTVLADGDPREYEQSWSLLMKDVFEGLLQRVDHVELMPGTEAPFQFGNAWRSKAESAARRAARGLEFEVAGDNDSAILEWQKIFGKQYE
jgi:hypothetical protein